MIKIARKSILIYIIIFLIIFTGYRYQLAKPEILNAQHIMLAVLLCAWMVYTIIKPAPLHYPNMKGLTAVMFMAIVVSVISAKLIVPSINELYLWIITGLIFIGVYNVIIYGWPVEELYKAAMIAGALYLMAKILQIINLLPYRISTCSKYMDLQNKSAAFLTMLLVLSISAWISAKGKRRIWPAILTITTAIAIMASGSRGGIISAAIASTFVVAFYYWKRVYNNALVVPLAAGLAATLAISAIMITKPLECRPLPSLTNQAQTSGATRENAAWTNSLMTRSDIYRQAATIFINNPLFGAGPGNFTYLASPSVQGGKPAAHAHNLYLGMLSERGLIGLVTTVAAAIYLARILWRSEDIKTAAAGLAVLIAVAVHGLPDITTTEPVIMRYLFLILAIAAAGNKKEVLSAGGWDWLQLLYKPTSIKRT